MRPDLSIEEHYSNYVIVGVDEVGRGAWAGPVVVGAVIFDHTKSLDRINDSKLLSSALRAEIGQYIINNHLSAIGVASVEEIDSLNINNAIRLAIERALASFAAKPSLVLLDGNYSFGLSVEKHNVIQGDKKSISIAAASIIAKHYRDQLMAGLAKEHPEYYWHKNVGYGTKDHILALEKYGLTKYHRLSYNPMKQYSELT